MANGSKLKQLEKDLHRIMEKSKDPILAFSGGKDSTFLLSILHELNYNVPVLVFPHFWSKHQLVFIKKIIELYKLKPFFYRASSMMYQDNAIIANYTIGDKTIPVVMDVIPGTKCGIDVGKKAVKGVIPYFMWDTVIIGTKKSDSYKTSPKFDFSEYENIATPLWEWSDEEVLKQTRALNYPIDERVYLQKDELADTGNFHGCMNCFTNKEVYCPKDQKTIRGIYYGIV